MEGLHVVIQDVICIRLHRGAKVGCNWLEISHFFSMHMMLSSWENGHRKISSILFLFVDFREIELSSTFYAYKYSYPLKL